MDEPTLPAYKQTEQVAQLCGITVARVRGMLYHTTPVGEEDLYAALVASERLRNKHWKDGPRSEDERPQVMSVLLNNARRQMVSVEA